jgi:hypothetical protein
MRAMDPDIALLLAQARELRQEAIALRPPIPRSLVDQAVDLARDRYTLRGPTAI